jgi:hypothetical protein
MNADHPQGAQKRRYTLDQVHSEEKLHESHNLIDTLLDPSQTYSEALSIDSLILPIFSRAQGGCLILFSFLLRRALGPHFTFVSFRPISAALFELTTPFHGRSGHLSQRPIVIVISSSHRNPTHGFSCLLLTRLSHSLHDNVFD